MLRRAKDYEHQEDSHVSKENHSDIARTNLFSGSFHWGPGWLELSSGEDLL